MPGKCVVALLIGSTALLGADDPKPKPPADDAGSVKVERPRRVRLGGLLVSASYSRYSGPYYYGYPYYYYPRFYDWGWYNPFFHPGFYSGFDRRYDKGEIKLRTGAPNAQVYLDGAYAGAADDLKSMWLDPGAYNLEVRADNHAPFTRRVYVLTGKTLKIDAVLPPENQEAKP